MGSLLVGDARHIPSITPFLLLHRDYNLPNGSFFLDAEKVAVNKWQVSCRQYQTRKQLFSKGEL